MSNKTVAIGSHAYVRKNAKKCILAPFWPFFRPKLVEMAQNFFHASDAKSFPTRGHMPMFERNYENWYIWSRNGLSGPFWPPFRPKLVKMAQHHYFLASDAKSFPTRGHMPMFEQNYENWYIWSHGSSINFGRLGRFLSTLRLNI